MTINDLIERLKDEAKYLPDGLNSEIGFATSPTSSGEILSIYNGGGKLWVDVGEP